MRPPLNISIDWTEKMQFTASNDKTNAKVAIDIITPDQTQEYTGTGPKHVFLQGLAGCAGGAIIFLLEKMRAEMPSKFGIDVHGILTTDHPMYFETIDMTYRFEGKTDENTLKKVVTMTEEKYCGLTYMLSKMAKINIIIKLNGKTIEL
jgi:putative redox protein